VLHPPGLRIWHSSNDVLCHPSRGDQV